MSSDHSIWQAVVDRIEESIVVLLLGPEEVKVELPIEFLPSDVREGSILSIDFRLNREATQSQRKKILNLIKNLTKRNED